MAILAPAQRVGAFRVVVGLLALAALVTFLPLWAPLLLATWTATMTRPLLYRISKALGGRGRAAGVIVVALVMAFALPLAATVVSLTRGVVSLVRAVIHSSGAKSALISLASGGDPGDDASFDLFKSPQRILELVQQHGAQAAEILGGIAGVATEALVGVFIFLYAVYIFLVDGPTYWDWIVKHLPIEPAHSQRLANAFEETGRGLIVGVGLTGLTQGFVATLSYFMLGVPRALVLGMLTCLASLIPSVGTALVWVPVSIGLAFSGRTGRAAILVGVGVLIIGSIDNLLRPTFARFGKLELSSFVLLTSIFGGLAMFGAWGFVLGPLLVRMAKEALVIARLDRQEEQGTELVTDDDAKSDEGDRVRREVRDDDAKSDEPP